MRSILARALGYVEIMLGTWLSVACVLMVRGLLLPEADPRAKANEWTTTFLPLYIPIAAALWLSGLALIRGWRRRWWMQVIPVAALACVAVLLLTSGG